MTHYLHTLFLCFLALSMAACKEKPEPTNIQSIVRKENPPPAWKSHQWSGYKVTQEFPHDIKAYTQGLLLSGGGWVESTGGYGTSSIRRVEKETGKILLKKNLAKDFFGEGLAELDGKFYQLTWENQECFVYDAKTLEKVKIFNYQGEGWGLTTDGKSLIMSNGTDSLLFLDPKTFLVTRIISVRFRGQAVKNLNELEFIEGEIFANVWHSEKIVRINPKDGQVIGVIDLTGIYPDAGKPNPDFVLNGIAYDSKTQAIYVTGKCWPKIYQIELIKVR